MLTIMQYVVNLNRFLNFSCLIALLAVSANIAGRLNWQGLEYNITYNKITIFFMDDLC